MPTRIVKPRLPIVDKIARPGGATVADAAAMMSAKLKDLRQLCEDELAASLQAAERAFAGVGDARSDTLAEMYALGRAGIGAGAVCERPHLDEILVGLCDLLQDLKRLPAGGEDAIAVHLGAWRLAMQPDAGSGAEPMLAGLAAVRARYSG